LITSSIIIKIHNLSTIKYDYSDNYISNFEYFLNCNFNNTTVKLLKRNWKFFNEESFLDLFKYFEFDGFSDVDELLTYFTNSIITVLDIILLLKLFFGYYLSVLIGLT